jgi:hypothetical protein
LLKPRQPYMLLAVSFSACCLRVSCCSSTGSLHEVCAKVPPGTAGATVSKCAHASGYRHTRTAGARFGCRDASACLPSLPIGAVSDAISEQLIKQRDLNEVHIKQ